MRAPRPRSWLRIASRLFGSSVIAQVAVLLATALAARRLRPDDFALLGIVTGGAWFLSTFDAWSADTRIPAVPPDLSASLFVAGRGVAYLVLAVTGGLTTIGLATSAGWTIPVLLTGVCGWLLGLQLLYTAVILRIQSQSTLALSRLVQGLSNAAFLLVMLLTPWPGGVVLSVSWLLSLVAGVAVIRRKAQTVTPTVVLPSRDDLRLLVGQVRYQPFASALAGSVTSMPLVILPALGAGSVSGLWAVANRFLNPAVNTVYNTLQPLYYGKAALYSREGRGRELRSYHRRWVTALLAMAALALGVFWAVIAFGLPLLGSQWIPATSIAVPAAIYFAVHLATLPVQHTLLLTGHLTIQFVWTTVRFTAAALPFALFWSDLIDGMSALNLYVVAATCTQLLHIALQRRALRHRPRHRAARRRTTDASRTERGAG